MLSDVDIDNLIQPFLDRQQTIEAYVIKKIAQRVKDIGRMLPSDIHKLETLYRTGSDVRDINKVLAELTGLQEKDIKNLIKTVAADSYIDAQPYYDYRRISYIPFIENKALQTVVAAVSRQTQKEFLNLSNTKMIGFVIRDLKHPKKLKFYTAEDTYKTVVDEAIQAIQSGVIDYGTAMRNTLKQLNNSGMRRVYWDSGYSQRMDTAVKRNLLDGVVQINQKATEIIGEQFKADGMELSAHELPAPDHAPFQGHQLPIVEYHKLQDHKSFVDTGKKRFPAQERALGQWNCKHFAYPIIIGVMKPTYTNKQLNDILKRNQKGMTLSNGKHLTGYEATQYQNNLALKVRQAKDGLIMAKQAGDMDLARQYQAKVDKCTKQYNAFNKLAQSQMQLSNRKDKLTVSGYRRISMKK